MKADYGDSSVEYAALLHGVGLADHSYTGRLLLRGTDALDLTNRLSSNKLEELDEGTGAATVLTTPKGRVVDLLLLGAIPGHLLMLTSPGRAQAVVEWFEFYTFGEDVTLTDIASETAHFTLAGPRARETLAVMGTSVLPSVRYGLCETDMKGASLVLWSTLSAGTESYELIVSQDQALGVWEALVKAGAVPTGQVAWEAFRIGNGAPVHGAEFGEETNPLESRLRGAISFAKGCYTGQEVIARLDTYAKVQRLLMAVTLSGLAQPGQALHFEGKAVGMLTSVAPVPGSAEYVALALVDGKHAKIGMTLVTEDGALAQLSDPSYALATEAES